MHQSNYYDEGSTYGASDSESTYVDTEVTEGMPDLTDDNDVETNYYFIPTTSVFSLACLALSRQ